MARPRSHSPVRRGPKRLGTWVGPADQNYVTIANGAKVLVASFDASAGGLIKPTLVRTRGAVVVRIAGPAADVSVAGAFGVAIVTDRAFAAGVASIPGPFTDAGWDGWAVWRSFGFVWDFADESGKAISSISFEVDSKGMRKFQEDDDLAVVIETSASSAGATILQAGRMLIKLQ